MKTKILQLVLLLFIFPSSFTFSQSIIIDHSCAKLDPIPEEAIQDAKDNLHIAYGHTSHGSQLITGMTGLRDLSLPDLIGYKGDIYNWNEGGSGGALDIDDYFVSGDLGHNGSTQWATDTRAYLNNSANSDVNVVMWSWCGGVSDNTEAGINTYLSTMNQLEIDYPNVRFVYMTGHADINSDENLKVRNQQIRDYCNANSKVLFDFYDIESYNPDGTHFEYISDNCNYYNSEQSLQGNWASEWRGSHAKNTYWFDCEPSHTDALNGNLKGYAAWWLWAKLAGWDDGGTTNVELKQINKDTNNIKNYPNPFDTNTTIVYELKNNAKVILELWNSSGQKVKTLVNKKQEKGNYEVPVNLNNEKGIYFYTLKVNGQQISNKMIKIK